MKRRERLDSFRGVFDKKFRVRTIFIIFLFYIVILKIVFQ